MVQRMRISDLAAAMEAVAPTALAEPWDNVGLLLGDPDAPLTSAHLAIDMTREVVAEAALHGASAIVSYHPPIFKPVKRVLAGEPSFAALAAGISVYSPHTSWDAVPGGVNDALADLVSLTEVRALVPSTGKELSPRCGMGRVGLASRDRAELIQTVREKLNLAGVLVAGPHTGPARVVAVCAGAGGGLLDAALRTPADVFLVGELSHHDALRAASAGMTVIATLHSNAERFSLAHLRTRLLEVLPELTVTVSVCDRDPLRIVS